MNKPSYNSIDKHGKIRFFNLFVGIKGLLGATMFLNLAVEIKGF
jgi:hypothetical protein